MVATRCWSIERTFSSWTCRADTPRRQPRTAVQTRETHTTSPSGSEIQHKDTVRKEARRVFGLCGPSGATQEKTSLLRPAQLQRNNATAAPGRVSGAHLKLDARD
eukprot:3939657-Rhodomonas_salina.1